jgi:hypothetical protein
MRVVTNDDIADIYQALGEVTRAAHFRARLRPNPDALSADELAEAVTEVLDAVPDKGRGNHDDQCWQRHAPCLAEKIRELLP